MEKWITCKHCGHYYSNKLRRCPECGSMTPPGIKQIAEAAVIVAAVTAASIGFVLGINDKGDIPVSSDSSVSSVSSVLQSDLPETDSSTKTDPQTETSSLTESENSSVPKETNPPDKNESSHSTVSSEKPPTSSTVPEPVPPEDDIEDIPPADKDEISSSSNETYIDLTYSAELTDLLRDSSDIPLTELTEEDKEEGIIAVTENADGTLTVRFTEEGFTRYKEELKFETLQSIDEIKCISNSQKNFIDNIVCNSDLSNINIKITTRNYNPEISSEVLDEAIADCWIYAFTYNLLIGESGKEITLSVTDSATGETLYTY